MSAVSRTAASPFMFAPAASGSDRRVSEYFSAGLRESEVRNPKAEHFFQPALPTHRRSGPLLLHPGDNIPPRRVESIAQRIFGRRCQMHVGSSPLAPNPAARSKHPRRVSNKQLLLFRRQFDHSPKLVREAKRRKNLPFDTEIRMAHVRRLDGSRELQSHTAEFISGHLIRPGLTARFCSTELSRPDFHLLFGSHNSTRLPSGSVIQANRP